MSTSQEGLGKHAEDQLHRGIKFFLPGAREQRFEGLTTTFYLDYYDYVDYTNRC